jgi:hypothetical protein
MEIVQTSSHFFVLYFKIKFCILQHKWKEQCEDHQSCWKTGIKYKMPEFTDLNQFSQS